jgi:hypothetical protein
MVKGNILLNPERQQGQVNQSALEIWRSGVEFCFCAELQTHGGERGELPAAAGFEVCLPNRGGVYKQWRPIPPSPSQGAAAQGLGSQPEPSLRPRGAGVPYELNPDF